MRSTIIKLAIPAMLLVSGSTFAALLGSSHDLSALGGNDNGEICIYCHTPHNTLDNTTAPLWNKVTTTATYTPYSSLTMVATGSPATVSLACLSCHDGTVATDSIVNAPGLNATQAGTTFMTGEALVGVDLTDDHPVGIVYATAQATDTGLEAAPTGGILLYDGKVECSSCHDVHDTSFGSFLVKDNANSVICTACHIK